MNTIIKKVIPHTVAIGIFAIIAVLTFKPTLESPPKELFQSDNIQAEGNSAEIKKYDKETGDWPLWTNGVFGGMPSYQINYKAKNLLSTVYKAFLLGNGARPPVTSLLLLMSGMYLLLILIGLDWRLCICLAAGFGFTSNYMDLYQAGHSTKLIAMAYMAPALAGILLTYRGKILLGGSMTALFMGLQLFANHFQISFYFFIVCLFIGIVYFIDALKNKELPSFGKQTGVLILAGVMALGANLGKIWTTQEYAEESIRGKSELTSASKDSGSSSSTDGLSKSYAFDFSMGINESMTFLIPDYIGSSSGALFYNDKESESFKVLRGLRNAQLIEQLKGVTSQYWGKQRFVGGPIYMGAIILFLALLGMALLKDKNKYWLFGAAILTMIMSWGSNFEGFNYFLFDNVPLMNKFRAVSMALNITAFLFLVLAAMTLKDFFSDKYSNQEKQKALYISGGIMLSLLIGAVILSDPTGLSTDLRGRIAAAIGEASTSSIDRALIADRKALITGDALRSFLLIGLSFGVLFYGLKAKKTNQLYLGILVALLAGGDLISVGSRAIDEGDFQAQSLLSAQFSNPKPVDQKILSDSDPHFRVLDLRSNPFSNASASYFHHSMGGYHAAKMMKYQEMIETYLNDIQSNLHIYGMFNTKYIIQDNEQASPNRYALGNAWFVNQIRSVNTADEELAALADFEPASEVIIQTKNAAGLENWQPQADPSATINLTSYHPDEMVYNYTSNSEQFVVFSEMYYPPSKGWKLYLDGAPYDDFRQVNFTLRGVKLPKGQNRELKMVFKPKAFYLGETIAMIFSILIIGGLGAGLYFESKN
jgi:hypothetical protein